MLMVIVEDYLVRHGNDKPDWNANFFTLPMSVISCLGDIAELCHIKHGYGKSQARTLWDRLQKVWRNGEDVPV